MEPVEKVIEVDESQVSIAEEAKAAIKALKVLANRVAVVAEANKNSVNIVQVGKLFVDLSDALTLIEGFVKVIKDAETEFDEKLLPDLMENLGCESIRVKSRELTLNVRAFFSITKDNTPAALEWLKSAGYEMIVKEGVHPQTLTTAMLEYVQLNGKLPPEDVISQHRKRTISMRKKK